MPSGKVHAAATLGLAAGFMLAARNGLPPEWLDARAAEALALGALAGILLTPDLDLNRSPLAKPLLGPFFPVWRAYWRPYDRLIGHRDWRSHFPLVGTLLRVLYLVIPPLAVLTALRLVVPLDFVAAHREPIAYLFLGLAASDALHALMDFLSRVLLPVRRLLRFL